MEKLKPILVAIAGPIGSEKKLLWDYLNSQISEGEKVSITKIAEEYGKECGLTFTNDESLREFMHLKRCIYGDDFFIKKINFNISATHIAIRTIKFKKEMEYLQSLKSEFNVITVGLTADPEVRLRRAQKENLFLGYNTELFLEYEKIFYPELEEITNMCDHFCQNNRDESDTKNPNSLYIGIGSFLADELGRYYPEYDSKNFKDPYTHIH